MGNQFEDDEYQWSSQLRTARSSRGRGIRRRGRGAHQVRLPPSGDLPYAVLVALHMPANAPSVLARIIDRTGPLPTTSAGRRGGAGAGLIYVAVPDHHLLVDDHRVALSEGPTENGYRPAINALFRSVALGLGPRAIGVLMSGVLDDGVVGAAAIRSRGGTTVVQRPDDALFPAMPQNALAAGVVDHKATAAEIGSLLAQLADRETEERDMDRTDTWNLRTGSRWAAVSRQRSTVRRWDRARDTPARTATAP